MPEKETIFSSKVEYSGVFQFSDFYNFCYNWLTDEMGLDISEDKYEEKLSGDTKTIEIEWTGEKEVTDYFKFEFKVKFKLTGLKKVEINQEGKKIETNKGKIKITAKGNLVRDYKGKFETTAFKKFLRSIYEKWVISSRIEQFQGDIFKNGDDFLAQAKSYLDLEGKR
ncbi:hypothetical protein CMI39_00340 [Candidatus Pacearchaeota archaeon]|jgi:hypothetical protein|nr:hypothetical protein [Candidatus Pacearchaeota archaeon]|tara:strand:- start:2626 stop:3129 length:504 start_codon:yes stop_codon:yes gene_type:complete